MHTASQVADRTAIELKLSQLVGHAKKGYKVEAARIIGLDATSISRNLAKPSPLFLKRLDRALEKAGKIETAEERAARERREVAERVAALEAQAERMSREEREAFRAGAEYARLLATIER